MPSGQYALAIPTTCACGASFVANRPHQRWCSRDCKNRNGRPPSGKPRTKRQSRRATPTQPRVVEKLVGTQLWMIDSSVACCPHDGCFLDKDTCPRHR